MVNARFRELPIKQLQKTRSTRCDTTEYFKDRHAFIEILLTNKTKKEGTEAPSLDFVFSYYSLSGIGAPSGKVGEVF
jgi:hypothetical protein